MRTVYFTDKYYTVNQMAEVLGASRSRLISAMENADFPSPDLRVGNSRLWIKESAESYFPQLRLFLSESPAIHHRSTIIQHIEQYVRENEWTEHQAYDKESDFRKKFTVKSTTIRHYGGWVLLVSKAFSQNENKNASSDEPEA